jgi:predicted RNase H-like HicB family nuclease
MVYHHEPEGWWARSADLPGFTAAGATFDEVRELAHSGVEFYLERPVEVEDRCDHDAYDLFRSWSRRTLSSALVRTRTMMRVPGMAARRRAAGPQR